MGEVLEEFDSDLVCGHRRYEGKKKTKNLPYEYMEDREKRKRDFYVFRLQPKLVIYLSFPFGSSLFILRQLPSVDRFQTLLGDRLSIIVVYCSIGDLGYVRVIRVPSVHVSATLS